jgi:hypothetical protein
MLKLYAKISYNDMGSYIEPLENLMDVLQGEFGAIVECAEGGEEWIIEIIEMEEQDFENLPEFDGW